jgi:hypothetical protein
VGLRDGMGHWRSWRRDPRAPMLKSDSLGKFTSGVVTVHSSYFIFRDERLHSSLCSLGGRKQIVTTAWCSGSIMGPAHRAVWSESQTD